MKQQKKLESTGEKMTSLWIDEDAKQKLKIFATQNKRTLATEASRAIDFYLDNYSLDGGKK